MLIAGIFESVLIAINRSFRFTLGISILLHWMKREILGELRCESHSQAESRRRPIIMVSEHGARIPVMNLKAEPIRAVYQLIAQETRCSVKLLFGTTRGQIAGHNQLCVFRLFYCMVKTIQFAHHNFLMSTQPRCIHFTIGIDYSLPHSLPERRGLGKRDRGVGIRYDALRRGVAEVQIGNLDESQQPRVCASGHHCSFGSKVILG